MKELSYDEKKALLQEVNAEFNDYLNKKVSGLSFHNRNIGFVFYLEGKKSIKADSEEGKSYMKLLREEYVSIFFRLIAHTYNSQNSTSKEPVRKITLNVMVLWVDYLSLNFFGTYQGLMTSLRYEIARIRDVKMLAKKGSHVLQLQTNFDANLFLTPEEQFFLDPNNQDFAIDAIENPPSKDTKNIYYDAEHFARAVVGMKITLPPIYLVNYSGENKITISAYKNKYGKIYCDVDVYPKENPTTKQAHIVSFSADDDTEFLKELNALIRKWDIFLSFKNFKSNFLAVVAKMEQEGMIAKNFFKWEFNDLSGPTDFTHHAIPIANNKNIAYDYLRIVYEQDDIADTKEYKLEQANYPYEDFFAILAKNTELGPVIIETFMGNTSTGRKALSIEDPKAKDTKPQPKPQTGIVSSIKKFFKKPLPQQPRNYMAYLVLKK